MKKIISILLLIIVFVSCKQEEYMPEPFGEKVAFKETTKMSLDEFLTSSQCTFFKKALDRGTVYTLLNSEWKRSPHTFLIPSDAAFVEAGFTQNKLENMNPADLDSIVLYHTLSEKIDTANVKSIHGNIRVNTRLESANIGFENSYTFQKYIYVHYLGIVHKKVLINGKTVGDYKISQTKEGDAIILDHFLKKPEKTLWQAMKADPRLSMFIELIEANDKLYNKIFYFNEAPWVVYAMQSGVIGKNLDLSKDPNNSKNLYINRHTSIFAPTNEAFIKAGYSTVEELLKLNDPYSKLRGRYLRFGTEAPYNYQTFHKTDSILSYHHGWGERYFPSDGFRGFPTVFFSNDLTNEFLGNYVLQMETMSPKNQPRVTCPFLFISENGKKKMRLKNAKVNTEDATIIEQDILTLNGPLYIVDRLFIPNHF